MNQRSRITAIVLTFNEEVNIEGCLRSLEPCCERIVVVDSGSTDSTVKLAKEAGVELVTHRFEGYAAQRNWAQANIDIRTDWVMHVDADERVSEGLKEWLLVDFPRLCLAGDVAGVLVRRRIRFMGREMRHGGLYPTYHCRLYRIQCGRCESRRYDQHFLVSGRVICANGDLIEDSGNDLQAWCAKHIRWAGLEAQEQREALLRGTQGECNGDRLEGKVAGSPIQRRRWWRDRVYGNAPLLWRAWMYFFYRMIIRGGILDGWQGRVYHLFHALWFRTLVDALMMQDRKGGQSAEAKPQ